MYVYLHTISENKGLKSQSKKQWTRKDPNKVEHFFKHISIKYLSKFNFKTKFRSF